MPWKEPRPPVDWDAQPLGQESDAAIAARLQMSTSSVTTARQRRGIPPYHGPAKEPGQRIDWSRQPLGRMTDTDLAMQIGVHPATVCVHRRRAGIPPYATLEERREKWDAIAETAGADVDAASAVSSTSKANARRRLTKSRHLVTETQQRNDEVAGFDWSLVDWSLSDRELERRHGMSRATFAARRPRPPLTDDEIAERLGVTIEQVAAARAKLDP